MFGGVDAGSVVDEAALRKARLVQGKGDAFVKILGNGDLTKKLVIKAHAFSKSALEKIQKVGGTAETLAPPPAEKAE